MGRRTLLVAIAFLVAAVVLFVLLTQWPREPQAPAPVVVPPATADTPPPALAASQPSGEAVRAEVSPATTPDRAPSAVVRLVGTVVRKDGTPLGGGTFFVSGRVERDDDTLLARGPIGADGRFEASFPYRGDATEWPLKVFVATDGWSRLEARAMVRPAAVEPTAVRLEVPGAGRIFGRVLDSDGRPVAGLRFGLSIGRLTETVTEPFDVSVRHWLLKAIASSDGAGRYGFAGLDASGYRPVSFDPAWELAWIGELWFDLSAGASAERDVRALPAYLLEIHFVDASSGAEVRDVRAFLAAFDGDTPGPRQGGIGPRVSFTHAFPSGRPVDVHVEAHHEAYRVFRRRIRVERENPRVAIDVPLEPRTADEIGAVVLEHGIVDAAGRPAVIDVVRWVTVGRSSSGVHLQRDPARAPETVVRVPSGTNTLEITPQAPFGKLLSWRGEVDVRGGLETRLVVPFVPHGSVRVRTRGDVGKGHGRWFVRSADPPREASFEGRTRDGVLHIPALPAGRWTLTVGLHPRAPSYGFDVFPSRVTEIEVGP